MAPPPRDQRPLRYRVLPVVTLLVAGAWAGACYWQARQVESANAARLFGMAFGGAAMGGLEGGDDDVAPVEEDGDVAPSGPVRSPLFPGLELEPPPPAPSDEEIRALERLQHQIGHTEVVVLVWKRLMFGVAGVVGLVGLIGLLTRWVRGPHLVAAVIMLAGTAATLAGMRLLQSPDGGGMPPLSNWSYVIAGVAMSIYPAVLIALLLRKRNPTREGRHRVHGSDGTPMSP